MAGRWTKGLLHLLVGGACAALVAWLAFGFTQTVLSVDGATRVAMGALVAVTLAVVAALLLAPPVRPAEVALARGLLGVDLPEPADTSSWAARGRGLAWAVAVIVLGGLSLLALLLLVPQGVALVVAAVAPGAADAALPLALLDAHPAVLAAAGLAVGLLGIALQPACVVLLERLAPLVLGPTDADRLAHAERERTRLLAANELARDLHDSVGHSLTAIGVQAEAGARVAAKDPRFAREALDRIARTTRGALGELDAVLGALRHDDAARTRRHGLPEVLELLGDLSPRGSGAVMFAVEPGEVDDDAAATTYRLVQEALTNARRHGASDPVGHIRVRDGLVEIALDNAMRPEDHPGRERRGLLGMSERVEAHGGSLAAGPGVSEGRAVWRVLATLPARSEEER